MKVKINEKIKGLDGVETLKGEKNRDLLLRDICINALLTPDQQDDEKKKWEKYEIFKKIRDSKSDVELKAEEITTIKKAIGKLSPPLIMGQCFELIEGK